MSGHEESLAAFPGLVASKPARAVRVAQLAERQLRSSPYLALRKVTCDCRGGSLVLRGCLPSYYLKQMAQTAVAHLDGVQQVVNRIEVRPSGRGRAGRP